METSEISNQLLKNKYKLHDSPEVKTATLRTQQRIGERVPQNPLDRIQNYLNRFHEIIDRGGSEKREHNLDLIKGRFHAKYVIKPDEVPEAYFENQRRLAREQGHGDIEITPEARSQLTEVIIADQTSSLDKWIDYLASPDAPYSDGLKYFTLRGVVNMAEYDKERKMYPQRSKGTTKPFPDLNREALAYVLDAIDKKYKGQNINLSSLDVKDAKEFDNLLKGENFAKLYAWAIEKITPASQEELSATKGEWVRYNQSSDHMPLVKSLQGHGTGWCTAGESTAQIQLHGGDFYVYYSNDRDGKPTVPRAAIRMEGSRIAEIRGIAPEQNLDSGAIAIVEEKLKEFPDGSSYQKRVADMRRLTAIENQIKDGQNPTGADLVFLYEIDAPIEGFGSDKDPRIEEIRSQRNPEEDTPIVFGCSKDQIARSPDEINDNTKAYVGSLVHYDNNGKIIPIFKKIGHLEHIYTSFPEGRIRRGTIEIGGRSSQQLEQELEQKGINISSHARDMLQSKDLITLKYRQHLDIIRLQVRDFDLIGTPTIDQIYARAKELGLELCPAEVGPHLRLKDTNQPLEDYYWIGMKQIADRDGSPHVFGLGRRLSWLWLDDDWALSVSRMYSRSGFIFSLRKDI